MTKRLNCLVFYKPLHYSLYDNEPHCTLYLTNNEGTESTQALHLYYNPITEEYKL
jgi:hypothetical protein